MSCLVLLGRPVFGALRRVVHGGFRARDAALHGFRVRSRYCTLRSCSWDTDEVPTLMKCLQWSSGCGVFGHPHAGSKFVSKSSQERLKERTSFRMLRLRAWLLRLCLKSTARQCVAVCFRRLDRVSEFKRNRHVQTTLTTFVRIGCSRGEWCSRCSRSRWCYRAIAARSGWTVYVDTSRRCRHGFRATTTCGGHAGYPQRPDHRGRCHRGLRRVPQICC